MKIKIDLDGRKIEIPGVVRCDNKAVGLMLSTKEHPPLLFEFSSPGYWSIHSLLVFYPFVAIWINGSRVVDCKVVKPFTLSVKPEAVFDKLIEIPINEQNKELVEIIVGK